MILFSSNLELPYDQLIDYYSLRFQIEFNFRDAKQFWGLEDFMNISQTAVDLSKNGYETFTALALKIDFWRGLVTNAANLSFFMVNLSHHLLRIFHEGNPGCGIVDLKAHFRGYKYVDEMIKLLPQKPEPVLLAQIFNRISRLGRIHPVQPSTSLF